MSRAKRSITSYLPHNEQDDLVLVQAKIPKGLRDSVMRKRKTNKHTIRQIMIAAFNQYLHDDSPKK